MKRKSLAMAAGLLAAFVLWTLVICYADVRPIGPHDSSVGLADINQFVHDLTGVNLLLYDVSDWLGLVPICVYRIWHSGPCPMDQTQADLHG